LRETSAIDSTANSPADGGTKDLRHLYLPDGLASQAKQWSDQVLDDCWVHSQRHSQLLLAGQHHYSSTASSSNNSSAYTVTTCYTNRLQGRDT